MGHHHLHHHPHHHHHHHHHHQHHQQRRPDCHRHRRHPFDHHHGHRQGGHYHRHQYPAMISSLAYSQPFREQSIDGINLRGDNETDMHRQQALEIHGSVVCTTG